MRDPCGALEYERQTQDYARSTLWVCGYTIDGPSGAEAPPVRYREHCHSIITCHLTGLMSYLLKTPRNIDHEAREARLGGCTNRMSSLCP